MDRGRSPAMFQKWHALGNAYLVIEAPLEAMAPDRARRLCRLTDGIGSDGVVQVVARDGPVAEIVIWNPDGSVAEMSGNGVRIAARWLASVCRRDQVAVVTAGREARALMHGDDDVEVDVGRVTIGRPETIDVGRPLEFTPVSVGNPHAVVRFDGATRDDLLAIGPVVERHPRFPQRTNVQLVEPRDRHRISVLVWERGAGETASSGSSSVAAAAVAVAREWCASPVAVELPGGVLTVSLDGTRATLRGPVEWICSGETAL